MKYLAFLLACSLATCSLAQDQSNDSVAYVVQLDDEMIEKLKQGLQLEEVVPPSIRHKISVVRVRYKPSPQPAGGAQPPQSSSNPNDFNFSNSNPNAIGNNFANSNTNPQPLGPPPPSWYRYPSDSSNINSTGSNNWPPPDRSANAANAGGYNPPPQSTQPSGGYDNRNNTFGNANLMPIQPQYNNQNMAPNNAGQRSNDGQWNGYDPNRQPNSSGSFAPGGYPNNSSNNNVPWVDRADGSFRQMPNNNRPQPPQGSEYDTRFNPPNANQFASGGWGSPQVDNGTGGFRPPNQPGLYPNQVNAGNGASPWPVNDQRTQPYGPAVTPTLPPPELPRRSSLVAGYHVPDVSNQLAAPVANRAGFRMAQNVGEGDVADSSHPPTAFINGHPAAKSSDGRTPISSIDQANRFNGILWFMLLCSIGLNVYLGWISRGFYIRYRELADELRETFSTAI